MFSFLKQPYSESDKNKNKYGKYWTIEHAIYRLALGKIMLTEYDDIDQSNYVNIETIPYENIFSLEDNLVEKFINFVEQILYISESLFHFNKKTTLQKYARKIEQVVESLCFLESEDNARENQSKSKYKIIMAKLKEIDFCISNPVECIYRIIKENTTVSNETRYQKITGGILFSSISNWKNIPTQYVYILGLNEENFDFKENYNNWDLTELFTKKEDKNSNNFCSILSTNEFYYSSILEIIYYTSKQVVLSHSLMSPDTSVIQTPLPLLATLTEQVQKFDNEFQIFKIGKFNSININTYKNFYYQYSYEDLLHSFHSIKNKNLLKEKTTILEKISNSQFTTILEDNNSLLYSSGTSSEQIIKICSLLEFILRPFDRIFSLPYHLNKREKNNEQVEIPTGLLSEIFFSYWKYITEHPNKKNIESIKKFFVNYTKKGNFPDGIFLDIALEKTIEDCNCFIEYFETKFLHYKYLFLSNRQKLFLYKKIKYKKNIIILQEEIPYYYIEDNKIHIIQIFFSKPNYLYKNHQERKNIFHKVYILLLSQFYKILQNHQYSNISNIVCSFIHYNKKNKEPFQESKYCISIKDANTNMFYYFLEKYIQKMPMYWDIQDVFFSKRIRKY